MATGHFAICPKRYARTCGLLYLYIIVAGTFAAMFVRGRLVVSGDAPATASNITANELLFRIGFTGELLHLVCDVAVAMILYALLGPVDRNIALLAAFLRLVSDVILAVASLSHFAALRLLGSAEYLKSFQSEQLNTLSLFAMKLHGDAYAICLLFFSFACMSLGYLIIKSSFLPKTIGILMAVAGASYLINSLVHFLDLALARALFPAIFLPIFIAESSLALWLITKGVDAAKWDATVRGLPALSDKAVES